MCAHDQFKCNVTVTPLVMFTHEGNQPWDNATYTFMCPYRRGSPLLMGVKSDHKLSTDHIPILYRSGDHHMQEIHISLGFTSVSSTTV